MIKERKKKHGDAGNSVTPQAPEYRSWSQMIQRCTNPKNPKFENYGGKGITVCDRWLDSYINFLEDMGRRPSITDSIDRIDVEKGYYKENCRWASRKLQGWNRSTTTVTLEQVNEIRELFEKGLSRTEIKLKLNLTKTVVNKIISNKTFKF